MKASLNLRAGILSLALLVGILLAWQLAVSGVGKTEAMDPEYAALLDQSATTGKSAMPGPLDVGATIWKHLKDPFYDRGPNDKGIGIQLAYSIGHVALGYGLAVIVAIPIGFLIGMSPLMSKALDPYIQILKPVSPTPGCRSPSTPSRIPASRRSS